MNKKNLVTLVNTNQIKPSIAPIAFDYLYPPLSQAGFEVQFLDLCFSDDFKTTIARYCQQTSPHFWGVTMRNTDDTYFSGQHSFLSLVKNMIGAIKEYSDAPIIMGGVGFSVMPENIMAYCGVDFGIICEGEISFPMLLTRLVNRESYHDLPGLVYRTPTGFQRNPITTFVDLSKKNVPARNFVNNPTYFKHGGQVGIETKRGCPLSCIYCADPLSKGQKLRLRNPVDVVDEIEKLVAQGIHVFHLADSEFNLHVKHAIAFCEEIIRRGLQHKITWYAYGMPSPLPDKLVKNMVDAGCAGLGLGVDSASPKMLRVLKRTFQPKHIAQAVETCHKHKLLCAVDLLFGAPGETAETIKETIDFVKKLPLDTVITILGFRIFPNTALAKMVQLEGIHPNNPNLHGIIEGNESFLQPMFYLSAQIAPNPFEYVRTLIGDDKRFSPINSEELNYDANELLVEAIKSGERGAYWAILLDKIRTE